MPCHLDHARREVEAENVGAPFGQIVGDVPGSASQVGYRRITGKVDEPVEQQAIDRLAGELVAILRIVGKGHRVIRRANALAHVSAFSLRSATWLHAPPGFV